MTRTTVKVTLEVSGCRECPFVTNSSREHNDAFTSSPASSYWWCKKLPGRNRYISDPYEIHVDCPFK